MADDARGRGGTMSTTGTHEAPYTVCVADLRAWLTDCLTRANPKCPVCLGNGEEDCPDCDGMGQIDCKCGSCGDEHQKSCSVCDGKGVIRCPCTSKDDPDFRIEFCGRILGYEGAMDLLAAMGNIRGDAVSVWAGIGTACLHVEERKRKPAGWVFVGLVGPRYQQQAIPRYPVEQQILPFVASRRSKGAKRPNQPKRT